jgi:hypothetical protein
MGLRIRVATVLLGLLAVGSSLASSHREAPFVTRNPKVDGSDFYMFRSYEPGRDGYVSLIANYQPLQDTYGGPNYFTMDPDALYEIHIDNAGDGQEHLTFQFRFQNALAGGNGVALNVGGKTVAVPFVNVGVVSPTDMSAQNVLEMYTVRVVTGNRRTGTAADITNAATGEKVFKRPLDNIGTKTFGDIPNSLAKYQAYANSFIYSINIPGCSGQGRMFVGQRKESFAVNLGPIFDLVNAPAAVITNDSLRGALPNPIGNKAVTTLALEVPTSCLVNGSKTVIGGWTTASVRQARVINPQATYSRPSREGGAWAQVSRLGNPLVNEVIIGIKDKDRFNSSEPKDDAQFADYVTNPTLPAVIELLFGPAVKAPTKFPRTDLVAAFLTGVPNVNANGATAEYQRLNTAIPATPMSSQNNLGALKCFVNGVLTLSNPGCDPAGFPNGRRPGDDVTDIELRVAMGALLSNDIDAPSRNVPFHDAVLQDPSQFDNAFPYLKTPTLGAHGDGT